MAQLYTTGPALLYAGPTPLTVAGGSPGAAASALAAARFLGTCESPPKIKIVPHYKPIFNDLRGDQVPFDKMYLGEEAFFSGVVNRFNWSTWAMLNSPPNLSAALAGGGGVFGVGLFGPAGLSQGLDLNGEIGSLVLTEAMGMAFYVVFPFAAKPAYGSLGANSMPAGYRFFNCTLDPVELDVGMREMAVHLSVHATPVYFTTNGSSRLYDFAVAGLPAPD